MIRAGRISRKGLSSGVYPRSLAGFVTVALLLGGCRSGVQRPFERIAVVPLENLSFDRTYDWIGVVAPFLLSLGTLGAERALAVRVESDRETQSARATQILRGYYTIEDGKIQIRAVLQDLSTNRTVREFAENGEAKAGPLPLLDAVSQALGGKPASGSSNNPDAWRAFGEGLLATTPERRLEMVRAAVDKDPKLTFASINAAQILAGQGQAGAAREILQKAIAAKPSAWERAQAEALLAGLEGNRNGILEAYRQAASQSPNDTDLIRQLAEAALNQHQYKEAVQWLQKAISLEPNQDALWNGLAYAQAYMRDFDGALKSLTEYRRRAPTHPNTLDSTGEIQWMAGRFGEAEKSFLEAQQRDPAFLGGAEFSKAAFARFLSGDERGADALWGRYVETRRAFQDPMADVRHAHWFLLTNRPQKAVEQLQRLSQGESEPAMRATLLLGVVLLQQGKYAEAKAMAQRVADKPRSASLLNLAGILAFLAQPPAAPEEWQARAQRTFAPQTPQGLRNLLLGYAFVLGGHGAAAVQMLEPIYRSTPPATADDVRMLLGKAKLDAGDRKGAADLLANHPTPPQVGEAMLASLYFPKYREWRKKALE